MKVGELKSILSEYPDDINVVLRVNSDTADVVDSGEYLELTDERNILIEYGRLVIIGDYEEEE